jgi:hypothetical protein
MRPVTGLMYVRSLGPRLRINCSLALIISTGWAPGMSRCATPRSWPKSLAAGAPLETDRRHAVGRRHGATLTADPSRARHRRGNATAGRAAQSRSADRSMLVRMMLATGARKKRAAGARLGGYRFHPRLDRDPSRGLGSGPALWAEGSTQDHSQSAANRATGRLPRPAARLSRVSGLSRRAVAAVPRHRDCRPCRAQARAQTGLDNRRHPHAVVLMESQFR